MRLSAQKSVDWHNREHFLGVAAAMMRRVLVDHARGHRRSRRGGGLKLPLANADGYAEGEVQDLVALDEALRRLARKHPQKSRVVELCFFPRLSIEETARVLKVSDSTIERDWKFARAWLARLLYGGATDDGIPFFVMEYVEGLPIDQYARAATLSTAERLDLFLKVCEAVSYAHRHRVIHRDLKPLTSSSQTLACLSFSTSALPNYSV
jgi:serine/threonine protein kinase